MKKSKKELFEVIETVAEELKGKGSSEYISFIHNMLEVSNKKNTDENKVLNNFYEILYNIKNSNIEVLGGGKALKENYNYFIDDFLEIKKNNNSYYMNNKTLNDLSVEELEFVIAWVRRFGKLLDSNNKKPAKSTNKGKSKKPGKNSNKKTKNHENVYSEGNSGFNIMADSFAKAGFKK
ncbi:hypothetical protein CLOACE_04700 [Clostridium acetireducens DSM 10703]|uniref:Uncharacterized protein n=1 Tax=Clostridium acetireducens DSM 10703 TaxID=1121290 RepID=A0A1E8F0S1_9CLOT|nr:hypothetical protein [Clostridium acetireducens]OFI07065.1 hypothetical protein CLOACE_04700 [Clostridium acetireducens DSM 10703]